MANFDTLPESITKLKTHVINLSAFLIILKEIRVLINKAPHEIGNEINKKIENIPKKNNWLKILQNISIIINRENPIEEKVFQKI